jgi:hypothetical protein
MFKKSVLQLLCWSSLGVFAQSTSEFSGYKAGADQVLKGISQYAGNGIMYNRVLPFSGLGQQKEGETIDWTARKFSQAVHEMEEASLQPPAQPAGKNLQRIFRQAGLNGDLPILAFCSPVQVIDTGRIEDSSLVLMNQEFKFKPKFPGQSPFREKTLSAACAISFHSLSSGRQYRFLFPRNVLPKPGGKEILSSRIRFAGNNWRSILPGQPVLHTFSEPGMQTLEIEIQWTGGLVEQYRNQLQISSEDACQNPDLFDRPDDCPNWFTDPAFQPSLPASPIAASIPFQGITGKGEILHYLRGGNTSTSGEPTYRNPIIFVDGIDFGDSRKGEVIFGKYLSFMPEPGAPASVRLGSQLRSQGHDLVILNFPDGRIQANADAGKANAGIDGGCDYIERNAMVLVRLIQKINARLEPGSQKLTIAGPSMGGLITRYALAYMEKNSTLTGNHNCGLYISQDAPHLGANIPVGFQQLIENLNNFNVAEAEIAWENLNSPAATELLINHPNHAENARHNQRRTEFLANCETNSPAGSLGWPKDPGLRMVALSNGNPYGLPVIGNDQPVNWIEGSGNMLSFKLEMKAKEFLAITMAIFGGGFVLPPIALLYTGTMEWKSFYTPAQNNTARTFSFNFGFSLFDAGIDLYSADKNWTALDQYATIDCSPGGYTNSTGLMATTIEEGIGTGSNLINLDLTHADKYHSFIPAKSALAFHWNSDGLRNVTENLRERNLVCTGETPFHAYYISSSNEAHIRLNPESAGFLYNQLNYVPPSGGIQYPAEITGPRAVAAGSRVNFTVQYQGNLEFRTSWSITQVNGVSASLTNPFSQSCSVLVSSGAGQDNGYYCITATTEVKSLNGEWVCAGRKTQKVQVRRVVFMGSIDTSCDKDLAVGCSFNVASGTPDYDNASNGVIHTGYQWQISRYNNQDFGSSCWNGALTITSAGTTFNGSQKARISLVNGYMPGNVFSYFVRVRNMMQIPNPDYGIAPGEPMYLSLEGVWKMVQYQTKQLPGPGCAICLLSVNIDPENPVSGSDEEVILSTGQGELPADFILKDEHGNVITKGSLSSAQTGISLKNLLPGAYTVEVLHNQSMQILKFWLQPGPETGLMASPSVLLRNSDKTVTFKIMNEHFTESGSGNYEAKIHNEATGEDEIWNGQLQEFSKRVSDFTPGNYRIQLNNGLEIIEATFTVMEEADNRFTLHPNPASSQVWISIPSGDTDIQTGIIRIKDKFGHVKMESEFQNMSFLVDTGNLIPDLYLMEIIRNGTPQHRWFLKE